MPFFNDKFTLHEKELFILNIDKLCEVFHSVTDNYTFDINSKNNRQKILGFINIQAYLKFLYITEKLINYSQYFELMDLMCKYQAKNHVVYDAE